MVATMAKMAARYDQFAVEDLQTATMVQVN
jgi:hypothetical protein